VEYNQAVYQQYDREEESAKMPFVTYADRIVGEQRELIGTIKTALRIRFGADGAALAPAIDPIANTELLRRLAALAESGTLEEVRALLPPVPPPSGNGAREDVPGS